MSKINKENNSEDEDEIIEMGPVQYRSNFSKVHLIMILISSSSLVSVIFLFIWINFYKIPTLDKKNISDESQNNLQIFKNKQENFEKYLTVLDNKLNSYQNKIINIEKLIRDKQENVSDVKLQKLQEEIKKISSNVDFLKNKISNLDSSVKKIQTFDNELKSNNETILVSEQKNKKLLLEEFENIKNKLFNKKILGSNNFESDSGFINFIVNHLAGFFNLRDYGENNNPRSLLTEAEKMAKEGNLEGVIKNVKKLPNEWRKPLIPVIKKYDEIKANKME